MYNYKLQHFNNNKNIIYSTEKKNRIGLTFTWLALFFFLMNTTLNSLRNRVKLLHFHYIHNFDFQMQKNSCLQKEAIH